MKGFVKESSICVYAKGAVVYEWWTCLTTKTDFLDIAFGWETFYCVASVAWARPVAKLVGQ